MVCRSRWAVDAGDVAVVDAAALQRCGSSPDGQLCRMGSASSTISVNSFHPAANAQRLLRLPVVASRGCRWAGDRAAGLRHVEVEALGRQGCGRGCAEN